VPVGELTGQFGDDRPPANAKTSPVGEIIQQVLAAVG
jgi:hypothetical protein